MAGLQKMIFIQYLKAVKKQQKLLKDSSVTKLRASETGPAENQIIRG